MSNLVDLDLTRLEYWVFDAMDTLLPRGDRTAETEAVFEVIAEAARRAGQPLEIGAREYHQRIRAWEDTCPTHISVGEEAQRRLEFASLQFTPEAAIRLFGDMTSCLAQRFIPYDGVRETLELLQRRGKRVLLYSTSLNLGRIALIQSLVRSGMIGLFDQTYFSVQLGHTKETCAGFMSIFWLEDSAARLGGDKRSGRLPLTPNQFVLLDDVPRHCGFARGAGWHSILVRSSEGRANKISPADIHEPWVGGVSELLPALEAMATPA
jgi:FMN phosphatase YigB (HAD superfamily)